MIFLTNADVKDQLYRYLISKIKDHQATTATDLHPPMVLVCLLDRGVRTQLGLEGECSVKALIMQNVFLHWNYSLR